ncbi:MAG: hypothetical protein ACTSW3_01670 [Promethearchaeota archaeon]
MDDKTQIESYVKYDDRRKELTHITKESKKTELGDLSVESKGIYKEDSIKKILKDLKEKEKVCLKNRETLIKLQEETPEMTPELQKIKDQLKILQKIDHDEKVTSEEKVKEKENFTKNEEMLKEVRKDIKKIIDAVGSRLKL